jgi:three-Cys-motif partner protein
MFEVEPYASRLKAALAADFPGRDCIVIPGDCNQTIRTALTELESVSWAPTFAFVDPNGPDTHWATLEALAAFRRARQGWKAEVLLLFADGMFIRMLPVNGKLVRPEDDERITTMYGTEQWKTIYEARLAEEITPAEAREEYVNLMRWRIENDLGYRWTHPFEVFNERGHSIYHMIFATDHPAGNTIMSSIYTNAAKKFPAMREAARHQRALQEEQAHGVARLFDPTIADPKAPVRTGELLYEHAKPWRPMGLVD